MRFHLEQEIEENIARGMPVTEARFAALRRLGGITQIKEECRGMRRTDYLENLWRDLRYTVRTLGKSPILGTKIILDSQPFTVAGVMPPGLDHPGNDYHALAYGDTVDVWWPFIFEGNPANRGSHYLEGIGRLKRGVTPGQAQAEMNLLITQLEREHPKTYVGWRMLVIPVYREIVGPSQRMLMVLLGGGCPGLVDCVCQCGESTLSEGHGAAA